MLEFVLTFEYLSTVLNKLSDMYGVCMIVVCVHIQIMSKQQ